MKAGTPTTFYDKKGNTIKVGDRIKHEDGTILTIDKFGRAVSPFGIVHDLKREPAERNVAVADGKTVLTKLAKWTLTDETPAAPEGETVKPGDDIENMAPPRIKDPRNESLKKENWKKNRKVEDMEAEAVQHGCTPDEARRLLLLQDYQDEDLTDELRARGYHGEIKKSKTIRI